MPGRAAAARSDFTQDGSSDVCPVTAVDAFHPISKRHVLRHLHVRVQCGQRDAILPRQPTSAPCGGWCFRTLGLFAVQGAPGKDRRRSTTCAPALSGAPYSRERRAHISHGIHPRVSTAHHFALSLQPLIPDGSCALLPGLREPPARQQLSVSHHGDAILRVLLGKRVVHLELGFRLYPHNVWVRQQRPVEVANGRCVHSAHSHATGACTVQHTIATQGVWAGSRGPGCLRRQVHTHVHLPRAVRRHHQGRRQFKPCAARAGMARVGVNLKPLSVASGARQTYSRAEVRHPPQQPRIARAAAGWRRQPSGRIVRGETR